MVMNKKSKKKSPENAIAVLTEFFEYASDTVDFHSRKLEESVVRMNMYREALAEIKP